MDDPVHVRPAHTISEQADVKRNYASPPPMWDLGPVIPAPHSSGPLVYPNRDECGICARFAGKVAVAKAAGLPELAMSLRTAWDSHVEEHPHRQVQHL
ncbi:hypothetical protein ABT104_12270 [Streptomyces mobaraensis]|uniref:hypothetical protein n=1 Tax=Streptomyces mobaraensis TaxID=35621 RepID=UPI00331FF6EB